MSRNHVPPKLRNTRLRLRGNETMAFAVEAAKLCARIVPNSGKSLVNCLQAFHHLLGIFKFRVMQDIDQTVRHERRLSEGDRWAAKFEEYIDRGPHPLNLR